MVAELPAGLQTVKLRSRGVEPTATCDAMAEAVWFQAALLDATNQPVIAVDLHRVVIYWNTAAEEMFGWSGAEAIGRTSTDLVSRNETPELRAEIAGALRRGESWSGDYDVMGRDGVPIAVYVTNKPVLDQAGALVAIIAVCVDLTERRADAEERRRLAAIVEGSGDAIMAATSEGLFTSWNQAAERLFGYLADDIIGRSVTLLVPPDRAEEQEQMRVRLVAGGPPERCVTQRLHRDGSPLEVMLTLSATTGDDGTVTGLAVIARDISDRLATRRALEASERRLAEAQRTARLGSFEFDVRTGALSWSAEYHRIVGVDPSQVPSVELFASLVHPDDARAVGLAWAGGTLRGELVDTHFRVIRPDGGERSVHSRAVPHVADDGTVVSVAGTLMDETARVEADRVRRLAERRFEVGFEQSDVGATLVDLDGIPLRVNAALCTLLGRTEDELVGRRWIGIYHPDDVGLGLAVLTRLAEGHDSYADERRFLRPDGEVVWASTHAMLVRDEAGDPQYIYAQLEDITLRKRMADELSHMALHDSLTGLPNRALVVDRLAQHLARREPAPGRCAVLSLNVDRLKAVNEAYGLAAGDDLLQQMALRIAGAMRPGDTAARGNGDEFVVTCHHVSLLEAEEIADAILTAVRQPFTVGAHQVATTISIGLAIADEDATAEGLLRDAAAAVRRAKERGRGRVELFDEGLRRQAEQRATTATALQEGLARDELVVYYQPVIDLDTGAMVSAEALVRWDRPGHGLVSPDAFIPLAEETGLIIPIGAWVLEEACRQLAEWQRTQPSMTVAVNLSVRQVAAPDIVELVAGVLDRTGVRPDSVCLELTESILMADVDYFGTMLGGLKALGVRLSIDDFGTGYSSLSYLKRFPVDGVKVDRSFVQGLGTNAHDSALVVAIVAMADALGLEATAEGVESEDQLARLRHLHCRRAQGFLLARPMPAPELTQLVADEHRWPVTADAG